MYQNSQLARYHAKRDAPKAPRLSFKLKLARHTLKHSPLIRS
jgi:hypothetical protein